MVLMPLLIREILAQLSQFKLMSSTFSIKLILGQLNCISNDCILLKKSRSSIILCFIVISAV